MKIFLPFLALAFFVLSFLAMLPGAALVYRGCGHLAGFAKTEPTATKLNITITLKIKAFFIKQSPYKIVD